MTLWKWYKRLYTQKRRKTVSESYYNFLTVLLVHKMPLPLKWWNVSYTTKSETPYYATAVSFNIFNYHTFLLTLQ